MGTLRRYDERVEERRVVLQENLRRLVSVCRQKPEVRAVYVFGSSASDEIGPTSDLDVLVVRETNLRFWDRGDDLRRESAVDVRLDLIVVTPDEYAHQLHRTSFGQTILGSARCVYAA